MERGIIGKYDISKDIFYYIVELYNHFLIQYTNFVEPNHRFLLTIFLKRCDPGRKPFMPRKQSRSRLFVVQSQKFTVNQAKIFCELVVLDWVINSSNALLTKISNSILMRQNCYVCFDSYPYVNLTKSFQVRMALPNFRQAVSNNPQQMQGGRKYIICKGCSKLR